jgi:acyl-CoA thioesterase-2
MTSEPSDVEAPDPAARPDVEPSAGSGGVPDDDPTDRVAGLLRLLELDEIDDDHFEVPNVDRGFGPRVFGGQVAAQALRAATRTIDTDHRPHSLHGYFILAGTPGVPIVYEVDRLRNGRSFSTRHVVARQEGEAIFDLSVSFHRKEDGVDYQQPIASDVPGPDEAPDDSDMVPPEIRDQLPMEFKELGATEPDEHGYRRATRRVWMRLRRRLPDDPDLHVCLLTFLSDMGAVLGARAPLPAQPLERLMGASLDHSMWFHRPMRADEWFLYELRAVSNAGARGLAVGTMHSADGVLGISVAQEALLRVVRTD